MSCETCQRYREENDSLKHEIHKLKQRFEEQHKKLIIYERMISKDQIINYIIENNLIKF